MPQIRIPTDELAKTFRIWLTVIAQRRPSLLRELWTRRGEDYDADKVRHARAELAQALAENLERAKWEVTREETMHERIMRDDD